MSEIADVIDGAEGLERDWWEVQVKTEASGWSRPSWARTEGYPYRELAHLTAYRLAQEPLPWMLGVRIVRMVSRAVEAEEVTA